MNDTAMTGAWKERLGHWAVYAAAAGAALAMSTDADAGIIYSGVLDLTVTIPVTGVATAQTLVSVNGLTHHLEIANDYRSGHRLGEVGLSFRGTFSAPQLDFIANAGFPVIFNPGQPITAGTAFSTSPTLRAHNTNVGFGPLGPGTKSGIIGFETFPGGDLGWMRVEVFDRNDDGYPDQAEVIDWAYNSTSGGAINAGQTTGTAPTPEPGTAALGLLASGAAGLLAWRRRRAETNSLNNTRF